MSALFSPACQLFLNIAYMLIGLYTILTSFLEFAGTGWIHADRWRGVSSPSSIFGRGIQ